MPRRKLIQAIAALALAVTLASDCRAGDELEHRHLTYIVARAIGFSPEEAEIISAASWSMDENDQTVAYTNTEALKSAAMLRGNVPAQKPVATSGDLKDVFKFSDYPLRGFAIHALASPGARDAMRAHYTQEVQREIAEGKRMDALVHAGMLVHFIVDCYVHPQDPLVGHFLEAHDPDYAIRRPQQFTAATEDTYRTLRQVFVQLNPGRETTLTSREAAFGTAGQRGLHLFATKAVGSLIKAYESAGYSVGAEPDDHKGNPDSLSQLATEQLHGAFASAFQKIGEPAAEVPEFAKITFQRDESGDLRFARTPQPDKHIAGVLGAFPDPSTEVLRSETGDLARAHKELVKDANEFVSAADLARHLHSVATEVLTPAGAPLEHFVFQKVKGELRLSEEAQKQLSEMKDNIGGVKLEVVFDLLSASDDMPLVAKGDQAQPLQDPILVSLRKALAAARAGRSVQDPLSLGGLTRVNGYLVDTEHDDMVLVGAAEPGVPPITLDSLVIALGSVWRHGLAPSVSLDPDPQNLAGPQHPRVIGISAGSRFAHIMLDADYAMKRVMMGKEAVAAPGYRTLADLYGQKAGQQLSSRFWLYPVRFNQGDIRWSDTGDIALFGTRLRVLTEQMVLSASGLEGVGSTQPVAEDAAREFTLHYREIAESLAARGDTSLKQLRGLLDLVTLCSVWRMMRNPPVLSSLADLEVPAGAAPSPYPGLQTTMHVAGGQVLARIAGGVQMRRSVGSRLLERYEDVQTRRLRQAAAQLELSNQPSMVAHGLTLLLVESQTDLHDNIELAFNNALQKLAANKPAEAVADLTSVLTSDPEFFEALVLRSGAYVLQKQYTAALHDLDAAVRLAPSDAWVQTMRLRVLLDSGSKVDMAGFGSDVRLGARDAYWTLGERQMVNQDFPAAALSFTKALQCDPGEAAFELLLRRGYAEELSGDLPAAERDYHASRQSLREKQAFRDAFGADPWAVLRDSLRSSDLALGMCRVEVNRAIAMTDGCNGESGACDLHRCQTLLSSDAECQWPAMDADRRTSLSAIFNWAAGKMLCLRSARQVKIGEGTFDRSFSQFEVEKLQESLKQLDSALDGITPEIRNSIGTDLVDEAKKLKTLITNHVQEIRQTELR